MCSKFLLIIPMHVAETELRWPC